MCTMTLLLFYIGINKSSGIGKWYYSRQVIYRCSETCVGTLQMSLRDPSQSRQSVSQALLLSGSLAGLYTHNIYTKVRRCALFTYMCLSSVNVVRS